MAADRTGGACAALAALAGILLAFAVFPAGLLLGLDSYWAMPPDGDNAANLIGYEAFARDGWRWPLFHSVLLAPPAGVNVVFTDLIPLGALMGKLVFRATGWLPNYFGAWLLLAYALQGLAGFVLLRAVRLPPVAALLGGLLMLLMPAFIHRFGHMPLQGHWALLVALVLYLRILRGGRRAVLSGAAFTWLMIWINPYVLVMVGALYAAALADAVVRRVVRPAVALAGLVGTGLALAGTAVALGYIEPGRAPVPAGGFGSYSLNLLSPVTPQLSLWPGHGAYVLDAVGGQYEGYSWFGFGSLGVIALGLVLGWRGAWGALRRHPFLVLACLGMLAYAPSNVIYAGLDKVATWPLPAEGPVRALTGIFRSSGRFVWPVLYVSLLVALVALWRKAGARWALVALAVLLPVQLADTVPVMRDAAARASKPPAEIRRARWQAVLAAHDELLILPQYLCAGPVAKPLDLALQLLAVRMGRPTNSVYVNRGSPDCDRERNAFQRNPLAFATGQRPLIAVAAAYVPQTALLAAMAQAGLGCRLVEDLFACTAATQRPAFLALGEPPGQEDVLIPGERVPTTPDGRGLRFLGAGWGRPEVWGIWGVEPEASLVAQLSRPLCGPVTLRVTVQPLAFGAYLAREAMISLNGGPPTPAEVTGPGFQTVTARLANPGCVDRAHVVFAFPALRSPLELGMNADPRKLGWGLQGFSLNDEQ